MGIFRILLLCFTAVVLHSTVMKLFTFDPFRPDLVLFALVYIGLKEGSLTGVWVGFFLGILQDIYRPSSLGVNALAKSLVGYLVGFFNERQWKIDVWARFIILFAAFLLHDLVTAALRLDGIGVIGYHLLFNTLPSYLYTLLIWAVLWLLTRRKGEPFRT